MRTAAKIIMPAIMPRPRGDLSMGLLPSSEVSDAETRERLRIAGSDGNRTGGAGGTGETDGGGGGIRTHGAFGTRDFQSRPLGLYGTPPDTRGGRGGIRTHGALLGLTAFRERHLKPLGHPSAGEYSTVADSPASSG